MAVPQLQNCPPAVNAYWSEAKLGGEAGGVEREREEVGIKEKKPCCKFMHPYYKFILIKQGDYTDIADRDYQNRMAPPAPCNPIN